VQNDLLIHEAKLRHLAPLNMLDDANLQHVADTARSFSLPEGAALQWKSETGWLIYVLSGRLVLLNSKGDRCGSFEGGRQEAAQPVFTSDYEGGSAQARSPVEFMRVDRLLYDVLISRQVASGTEVAEVSFEEDDTAIFSSLYDAFAAEELQVPSLPEVMIAVNKAISDPDMGFAEIAAIIQKDPPYTARLIQMANSPAYASANEVTTLSFAISRIGTESVRSLVMALAVSDMVDNVHPSAVESLRRFYQDASEIAALSFVLARRVGSVPEERALMAGLLHRLGMVPIVSHACEALPAPLDTAGIEGVADRLIEPVTSWLLSEWGLDAELCDVAESASDWYRNCEEIGLLEVVIAARLLHATAQGREAPAVLAETPIGQKFIVSGLALGDLEAFLADAAEDLEAARQLVS